MAILTRNKPFLPPVKPNKFRRLAMGSWARPDNPTIYGILEVNVEPALRYLDALKNQTEERLTITHYLGKVFAEVLKLHPELNCELRYGKFYPRASVDLSFQVAIEDELKSAPQKARHDLSAGLVLEANKKSIIDIARELNHTARSIRNDADPVFQGIKKLGAFIPGIILNRAVGLLRIFLSTFNLWSPLFGLPKNAFGGMMLTNVGSLGLDLALPALFPPASVSSIVAIGAIYKAPVYVTDADDRVIETKLQRHMKLCGAFDHRYLDGIHASRIARDIRRLTEHPETWLPAN